MNARLDVHEHVIAPQALDDVGARDEESATFDEQNEHVHRLSLEANRSAMTAQLVRCDVELEIAKAKRLAGIQHRIVQDARVQCHKSAALCQLPLRKNSSDSPAILPGRAGTSGRRMSPRTEQEARCHY